MEILFKNVREVLYHHPAATVFVVNNRFFLNLKAQEVTGYQDSDFPNLDAWFITFFKDRAELMKSLYFQARTLGFPDGTRLETTRKDGKCRTIDLKGTLVGDIEIWSITDVTDMILIEERFSVLFNHSTEPHVIFDENGLFDCNDAMVKLMNASKKEQIVSAPPGLFSPEKQPCGELSKTKRKQMDEMAWRNGSHRFEWVLKKLTGEECHVEVTVSVISLAGRKMLMSVIHDLTEAKRTQAHVLTSAKMATLGEMASNIAHEINNPLAIIYAVTHRIKKQVLNETVDKTDIQASVDKINSTVNRISKIIKGLLFFAREAERGEFEDLDIRSVVVSTLDICHEKMKNNGIRIDLSLEQTCIVHGQGVQISQVVMNLISNSFDAICDSSDRWISISSGIVKGKLHLRFTDSGLGISEHVLSNMMKPFFTTKEVGKGTGLGLSVSKGIIENHAGRLFYDELNGHTSFVIELPVKDTGSFAA